MSTERIATLKRGRGGVVYRQKICFLNLQENTDRKRLFCANVPTLLSMIVDTLNQQCDDTNEMSLFHFLLLG